MTLRTLYYNTLFGSVNVVLGEYEKRIEVKKQSEFLVGSIEDALKENNLGYDDVDVFATISGPGNFTSIKTNLAVAKAIQITTNKKVIVSNLFEINGYGTDCDFVAVKSNPNKFYVKGRDGECFIATDLSNLTGKIVSDFSDKKWQALTEYKVKNGIFDKIEPLYIENASITIKKCVR